jgi:hypothetical protein
MNIYDLETFENQKIFQAMCAWSVDATWNHGVTNELNNGGSETRLATVVYLSIVYYHKNLRLEAQYYSSTILAWGKYQYQRL